MVTVRNDIEMMATAPDGTKVKDVNLKQEAKPARRRRSYRCITTVGVVAVVLLSLAVGGVLLYEYVLNGTVNSGDESPSSAIGPEGTAVHQQSVPAFSDPFDGMPAQPEIALDPDDEDNEIDIDGTPPSTTSTTTTTAATTTEPESIDEGSGVGHGDDDNEDVYHQSSGSGSGEDDMW